MRKKRTFKQHVRDQAKAFAEIYEVFLDDLKTKIDNDLKTKIPDTLRKNNWEHLFSVSFSDPNLIGEPKREKNVKGKKKAKSKKLKGEWNIPRAEDAVLKTLQDLEVHRLPLGPITIENTTVSAAFEIGTLTRRDVARSKNMKGFAQLGPLSSDDPVFWRTVLEIFCRAFTVTQGSAPWSREEMIHLAFDMDEIRSDRPAEKLSVASFRKKLNSGKYQRRYAKTISSSGQRGVGEDRIRQIINLIGPMDNGALSRLADRFPDEVLRVEDDRLRDEMLRKDEDPIGQLLDITEGIENSLASPTNLRRRKKPTRRTKGTLLVRNERS